LSDFLKVAKICKKSLKFAKLIVFILFMKRITVRKVNFSGSCPTIDDVESLFDANGIEFNSIDVVDWPQVASYCPEAKFRIMHSDDEIYLQYVVRQEEVRAVFDYDFGGKPYTDDCVEFFMVPSDTEPSYYNLEFNCIGHGTFNYGAKRQGRVHCDDSVISQIRRKSTLGCEAFGTKQLGMPGFPSEWRITIAVPKRLYALADPNLKPFGGRCVKANFYKCGDDTTRPHFISWNKIEIENPDFHRPDFFGELSFQ